MNVGNSYIVICDGSHLRVNLEGHAELVRNIPEARAERLFPKRHINSAALLKSFKYFPGFLQIL